MTLRGMLQSATDEKHAHLHRVFGPLDLRDKISYRAFLRTQAAALIPLEHALEGGGIARLFPDWPARRRRDCIAADLAALGSTLPPASAPPVLRSDAACLGALYVLDGSRMGARMLLKQVAAATDPQVRHATRFLSHGRQAGFFQSFLRVLEAVSCDAAEAREMTEAARAAFDLFLEAVTARPLPRTLSPPSSAAFEGATQ